MIYELVLTVITEEKRSILVETENGKELDLIIDKLKGENAVRYTDPVKQVGITVKAIAVKQIDLPDYDPYTLEEIV